MKDIDWLGIAEVMERALAAVSTGTGDFHVPFDLDVCDSLTIAPGVGTPVKGGFDYREAHFVSPGGWPIGPARRVDLVEVNPALDVRKPTWRNWR